MFTGFEALELIGFWGFGVYMGYMGLKLRVSAFACSVFLRFRASFLGASRSPKP